MEHYLNIVAKNGSKRTRATLTLKDRPQYNLQPKPFIATFSYRPGHGWTWCNGDNFDLAILTPEKTSILHKALNKLWRTERETAVTL